MARDGLLPESFSRVHPRFKTPHVTTIWIGVAVGLLSAFANLDVFIELTNIGTLFAFILVCIGILVLRRTDPHRKRAFRTPFVPFVPLAGIAICLYLIVGFPWFRSTPEGGLTFVRYGGLPGDTWLRFVSGSSWDSSSTSSTASGSRASPKPAPNPPFICYTPKVPAGASGVGRCFDLSQEVGMKFGKLASAGLFAALVSAPLLGQASTKKYDWAPINGAQEIDVRRARSSSARSCSTRGAR